MDLLSVLLHVVRCENEEPESTSSTTTITDAELHQRYSTVQLVRNVLSSWLQTALNLAVTASHCAIPVFGLWSSSYGHASHHHDNAMDNPNNSTTTTTVGLQYATRHPAWMQNHKTEWDYLHKCLVQNRPRRFRRRHKTRHTPRIFCSPTVAGALLSDTTCASFSCQ